MLRRSVVALSLVGLLAGTGVALAQNTQTPPAPEQQRGPGMGRHKNRLGLTEDQRKVIKGAYEKHREEQRQAWRAAAAAQKELRQLALNGADAGAIQAKTAEVQQLMGQSMAVRVKVLQEIGPVLTPEQRAKFAEGHGHRGMRHHRKSSMSS
jgi:Spy/CpxP family protein refolding chaperone